MSTGADEPSTSGAGEVSRDAWRVDGVAAADDGDTFRVAARAPGDGRPWTLLFASDDRDVIVALMKK